MHDLGVVHGNLEIVSYCTLFSAYHMFTFAFTFLQINVLVDSEETSRIAGLGSVRWKSSPAPWSEDPHELTRCSAPELANPDAFGLPKPHTTEASDIYAFGVLAYQVKHVPTRFPNTRLNR